MRLIDQLGDRWTAWMNRTPPNPAAAPPPDAGPVVAAPQPARKVRFGQKKLLLIILGAVACFAFIATLPKPNQGPAQNYAQAAFSPQTARQVATMHPPVGGLPNNLPGPRSQAESDAALRASDQRLREQQQPFMTTGLPPGYGQPQPAAQAQGPDLQSQERDRRNKSLFASPVILIAQAVESQPAPASAPAAAPPLPQAPPQGPVLMAHNPPKVSDAHRKDCLDVTEEGERFYAVCEGRFIELTLMNRLVGDYAGPVVAILAEDVYSRDRQHLLMPKGTQIFGRAEKVDNQYQQRMVIKFHRILFENGRGYWLDNTTGLDQAGESALKADKINRHLLSTFSTSIALALISGWATYGTGGYYSGNGADMYRQGVAQNLSMQAQQQASQNLNNRRPTITVDEGHQLKMMFEEDLLMPEYKGGDQ